MILIANDQEWSARTLESILGPSGYAVLRAYSGQQALDLARTTQPDLVILDERMPDLRGSEVCRILRDDPRVGAHTPIVIVTADSVDREQLLAGYRAGAWDYVQEPVDAEVLLLRIGSYVRAKRCADRMRDESLLDPATGLYNMRGIERRAREIGAEAFRQRSAFACVAVAPETWRTMRDRAVPDDLADYLAEHVSAVLRRGSRASDAVGRLGRTEFAIIAPSTEAGGAVRLVERLQRLVDEAPLRIGNELQPVRLRAGYSAVSDFTAAPVDAGEMLARAASALRHLRSAQATESIRAFEELPLRLTP